MATVEAVELQRLADDGNPHVEPIPHVPTEDEVKAAKLAEYDAETVRLVMQAEVLVSSAEAGLDALKADVKDAKATVDARTHELRSLIREREANRGKREEPTLFDDAPAEPTQNWRAVRIDDLDIAKGIKAHMSFETPKTAGELWDEITSFNPTDGVPFGLPLGDVAEIRMAIAALRDAENPPAPVTIPADLWREYPIARWSAYGLTAKDVEKMANGEVKRESGRRPLRTVGDLSDFSQPTAGGYSRQYADIKGIGTAGADRISNAEAGFWQWWKDGGEEAFAKERGVFRGDATSAGPRSGATAASARPADQDDDDTDPDATDVYEPAEAEAV